MDEIVKAALKKWPNVPDCRDWLGLDARGDWYMRDDRCQAAGPFPQVKGSRIQHEKLREFIHRNYLADAQGAWFFQNGPQRVYVELEAAPWIWRLEEDGAGGVRLATHTGQPATPGAAWLDEQGRLFLDSPIGLGLVHTLDMGLAAEQVERGLWVPETVRFAELPARHGYVPSPAGRGAAGGAPARH
ncbi:DUF2946 family protein [Piscinibacter sakaiensis]|uniref:DUF2946 family protein n=1 Tax=Piscinibacter sakaiensis TaxID=1547922 RepID=A0A0K8P0E5_PISS1|nr:DUF2946 family protein [Piscinibacter sakaiensis]GAP36014.1 hypothetical protein ISF6_1854 [Piscinibacter sakaiensis]